ncbi:MAG: glycosyl hydrolase family 32 [Cytophagales bacterium CG12_big_fil_rev_8_21_14_0_65_40_12]|nr:MAG: glycosyl hydrolase family 32 [Cytophagales bacterium CG12_big_fil_rev_8_21_14_0_65_40_12]PIW06323.1 MAG: glycosyl hydrolase family 32 [Cytophagales bacterium CG17_big_fil_post_rev_8_21_14_2_50_40_13]
MKRAIVLLFLAGFVFLACSPSKLNEAPNTNSDYYNEEYRPQFHFSPDSMWMNDPNGMVYLDGEYHLFYQYYPDSNVWGPMHWGHAVSPDMVKWQHLPIALFPDELGYIFSGSAVYDKENTSGLGTKENPPLVAIYTYHDMAGEKAGTNTYQTQGIASSTDQGRTWKKYEGNPVIPNPGIRDFRDPKVIWHEESKQWVMVFAAANQVKFYGSPDLKNWSFLSDYGIESGAHGGVWECPDLLKMELNGETKWVLLVSINPGAPNGGSGTQYFIGDFDGKTFTNDYDEALTKWIDFGRDNYAGVTWSNVPKSDSRTLFLGWMSNWDYATVVPTYKWRSAMTVPRALSLEEVEGDVILVSKPVAELVTLENIKRAIEPQTITTEFSEISLDDELLKITLEIELGDAERILIQFKNDKDEMAELAYNIKSNSFLFSRDQSGDMAFSDKFVGVQSSPRLQKGNLGLEIYLDRSSIEIFADGGKTNITNLVFSTEPFNSMHISTSKGQAKLISGSSTSLKSIWR